jgi:hypothetical protein
MFDKSSFLFASNDPGSYTYWQQECSFTYNDDGMVISREERNIYNRSIHTYQYTGDHRLLQEDLLYGDTLRLREVHHYSGAQDSVITYRFAPAYPNESLPAVSEYTINEYDTNGKIISWRRMGPYRSFIEGGSAMYDSSGHLTGRDHISVEYQTGKIVTRPTVRWEYDDRNLNILFIVYSNDGKVNSRFSNRYTFY